MTIRDLGYRAYEGTLLPASRNTWVLARHGIARIWGSWLNRLAIFFTVLPLLAIGLISVMQALMGGGQFIGTTPAGTMRVLTSIQFWFVVSVVTLRSGASVIAEDFTNRAYQFYLSKPVTPLQYLAGRALGLATFLFALVAVPTIVLAVLLAALGPREHLAENLGLVLPALLDSALIAVVCSVLSIAFSALSKSRALTMMAWGVALFVPAVLASLIEAMTGAEWGWLASPAGLLWVVGDALYKVEHNFDELHWYHAAPLLAALTAGGAYLALFRIRNAEVIT